MDNTTKTPNTDSFSSFFNWSKKQCLYLVLSLLVITLLIIILFSLNSNNYEKKIEKIAREIALQKEEYNVLLKIKSTSEKLLDKRKETLKNLETIGLFLDKQEHFLNLQEYYNSTCNEWKQEYSSVKILGTYNSSWGRYCVADVRSEERDEHFLLIRDLVRKSDHKIDLDNEGIRWDVELTPNDLKDRATLTGCNGANSIFYREYFAIVNLKEGSIRHIDSGYPITVNGNRITVKKTTMLRFVTCNADSEYASVYSHYTNQGDPVYLLNGDIKASGYDSDGDRVSMSIYIDLFGNVSGKYVCSAWFSDYELSGERGSDGVLRLRGKNTWGRNDAEFVFSAPYNGKIEGYCDTGNRKYEITLSY